MWILLFSIIFVDLNNLYCSDELTSYEKTVQLHKEASPLDKGEENRKTLTFLYSLPAEVLGEVGSYLLGSDFTNLCLASKIIRSPLISFCTVPEDVDLAKRLFLSSDALDFGCNLSRTGRGWSILTDIIHNLTSKDILDNPSSLSRIQVIHFLKMGFNVQNSGYKRGRKDFFRYFLNDFANRIFEVFLPATLNELENSTPQDRQKFVDLIKDCGVVLDCVRSHQASIDGNGKCVYKYKVTAPSRTFILFTHINKCFGLVKKYTSAEDAAKITTLQPGLLHFQSGFDSLSFSLNTSDLEEIESHLDDAFQSFVSSVEAGNKCNETITYLNQLSKDFNSFGQFSKAKVCSHYAARVSQQQI